MKLNYHRNMVRKTLKKCGFGQKCIDCAVEGNEDQDGLGGQDNTEYHFDGCDFQGGAEYISSQWAEIQRLIAQGCQDNLCDIMKAWGRLSHAVQDFYAHSNWVELGNTEPWDLDPTTLPDGIVSGIWFISDYVCRIEGKDCPTHGALLHDRDDISKDEPGRPNFGKALRLAYRATTALAERLKTLLPKDCFDACG
jgi:hypothetical protein